MVTGSFITSSPASLLMMIVPAVVLLAANPLSVNVLKTHLKYTVSQGL